MARTGSRGSPEAGHRASHRPPARREAPEHTRGGGGRCESPWPTTEAGSETQKPLHLIRGRNTTSCTGSAARPRRPSAARGAYAAEKLFFQTPELFFSLVPSPRKVAGSLLAPPGARSLCSLQLESGKLRGSDPRVSKSRAPTEPPSTAPPPEAQDQETQDEPRRGPGSCAQQMWEDGKWHGYRLCYGSKRRRCWRPLRGLRGRD